MVKNALGMVETVGLTALIEAVDAMTKAAEVKFVRWETAGSGRVAAFVEGEVAAVKAAVDAGAEAAAKLGEVMAAQVVPNPHAGLDAFTAKKAVKAAKA